MAVLHKFRWCSPGSMKVSTRTEILSPQKAIRRFCFECYGFCEGVVEEVKNCPSTECPLYPFRFGKDPGIKVKLSDEERKRRADHARSLSQRHTANVKSGEICEITV